jgi:hypothetical protein
MNSHLNPHWIVVDIEPSIALARAECLEMYRKHPAQPAPARNLMKEARLARSMYQRDLVRQFVKFLASFVASARSVRSRGLDYRSELQPSLSTSSPRGA